MYSNKYSKVVPTTRDRRSATVCGVRGIVDMGRGSAESTSLSAVIIPDKQQHGIHLHIQLYIQLADDGLATYDSMRIPDAITFFLSTLHGNFGHCAQVLWMKYMLGLPLRKAWVTVGLAHFLNKAAVRVNDKFLAHVCTGVTWVAS